MNTKTKVALGVGGLVVFIVGANVVAMLVKSGGGPVGAACQEYADCKDRSAFCLEDKAAHASYCSITCSSNTECTGGMTCEQWQKTIDGSGKHISTKSACFRPLTATK